MIPRFRRVRPAVAETASDAERAVAVDRAAHARRASTAGSARVVERPAVGCHPPGAQRAERGVALVMVILVLVALTLIAAPFALSMRHLESSALVGFQRESALAGAEQALAAARRGLQSTHPALDVDTPHLDGLAELAPQDLAARFPDLLPRDPRGSLRSVRVEDERSKVHLGTASLALLGNLLGGRAALVAEVAADDTLLQLDAADGWASSGVAWLEGELVEWSARQEQTLDPVRRGLGTALLPASPPAVHARGSELYDARLLHVVLHGWHLVPGRYSSYLRVDGLRDLARFSEFAYDEALLERVRPLLSVQAAPPRWQHAERVLGIESGRDGRSELLVADGSHFGAGAVVQLRAPDGARAWTLVLAAVDWGARWHLSLLEPPPAALRRPGVVVEVQQRVPVNLATAGREVCVALFTGVGQAPVSDVIDEVEASHLGLALVGASLPPGDPGYRALFEPDVQAGRYSAADLERALEALEQLGLSPADATPLEVASALVGLESRQPPRRVGRPAAEALAARVVSGRPESLEQFAALLASAVSEGEIDAEQRLALLRNALDPDDARLSGGTAPLVFECDGLFTLDAAASENQRDGRERSRVHVRELLSVAAPGKSAQLFATQADFELAAEPGPGWESLPLRQRGGAGGGQGAGAGPDDDLDVGLPVASVEQALRLGQVAADRPVERADALAAGAPPPSGDALASALVLAPLRSPLPGTLHFDEGVPGLSAASPEGHSLAAGPLRLPWRGLAPQAIGRASGLLQPFAVEFWFQTDDPQAETVLFESGADELENRVLVMLEQGSLVLRVSDASIADFEAVMPAGRPPPAGEIRYAFDDGLQLLPGMPYHVLAFVGGARDSALMLFVDGVPRGQRSFTTYLTQDMDAVGALSADAPSTARAEHIEVASTAGFPARGALRIGWEVVEYVDKTETSFVLRAETTSDPFGGRARRATVGGEHEAGELVELHGYSRPLASSVAAQGNRTLPARLAEFSVAELDPDQLDDRIEASLTVVSGSGGAVDPIILPLGTGLLEDASSIPVRGLDGGSLQGVFAPDGGHALLICTYGGSALTGFTYPLGGAFTNPSIPGRTTSGAWIGGAEVVRYESFDGGTLQGCRRNAAGIPVAVPATFTSSLAGATSPSHMQLVEQNWDDPRAWPVSFSPELLGALGHLPQVARVLVVPISIDVGGGNLNEDFNPFPEARSDPLLVQLGLDFPEGGGGTEWVRWDTPTADCLVRDEIGAIEELLDTVASTDVWIMDGNPVRDDQVDAFNDALDFRGQGHTADTTHEAGDEALPVHVLGGWGVVGFDPVLGIPGRHDATTLVGDDGASEWHVVNHAVSDDPDWGPSRCLVAFREAVVGDFAATPSGTGDGQPDRSVVADRDLEAAVQPGAAGERLMQHDQLVSDEALEDVLRSRNADSRRLTRLVKAPSGELPAVPLELVRLGEHGDGRPAPGGALVDELAVHVVASVGPLLPPTQGFRLAEDLLSEEDDQLVLAVEGLVATHAQLVDEMLGAERIEVLGELPESGGLLLVDEEIVGYAGVDALDSGAVFLTARGLYGTRRARHVAGVRVQPLSWWPVSPLVERLRPGDARVAVADPGVFPPGGGLLWVDEELLAYDEVSDDGLLMPGRLERPEEGLLRGRFGTLPADHAPGTMVRWMPARVADRALLGQDVPEAEAARVPVFAPGAFFTDLAVQLERPDERVELEGRIVLDRLASRHDDPSSRPGVLRLPEAESSSGVRQLAVGRQADLLELWLMPRWLPGAFDPRGFAGQGWKVGPRIKAVVVEHLQPDVVFEHEEWR